MSDSTETRRWIIGLVAALALVLLIAYARNGPGVGGREPDPPVVTTVASVTTIPPEVVEPPPSSPPST
jgi:hypothetical protein